MRFSNHITQTSFLRKPIFSVMLHPKEHFSLYLTLYPPWTQPSPCVCAPGAGQGLCQRQEASCFAGRLTGGGGFSWAGRKRGGKAAGSSRGPLSGMPTPSALALVLPGLCSSPLGTGRTAALISLVLSPAGETSSGLLVPARHREATLPSPFRPPPSWTPVLLPPDTATGKSPGSVT